MALHRTANNNIARHRRRMKTEGTIRMLVHTHPKNLAVHVVMPHMVIEATRAHSKEDNMSEELRNREKLPIQTGEAINRAPTAAERRLTVPIMPDPARRKREH